MILLYSTHRDAKARIVTFIQTQSQAVIVIAETVEDIPELVGKHRPQMIFLHMPGKPGTARDIQAYIRGLLPQSRIRLLPCVAKTEQPVEDWKDVIIKSLQPRSASRSLTSEGSQS